MNINRDYLIINDVKKSNVKLDNGSVFFYITDKNTQNIFVNLVINVSNNDLIQKYANIENAEDYTLTMNIVKPDNTYKIIEGKLHDKEKAIFEFNLSEDCVDKIGSYKCELLTKCNINDHEEITTSNKLTYKVKSSVLNDLDGIQEAPEYPLVIQLFDKLSDIEQYEEDRRANELARQLAEEQRQTRFNTLDADMVDRVNAMDSKMDDVEARISAKEQAVDKLIVDTKVDIDDYKVAKDTEIDEYKTAKDTEINNAITAQDNKIDTAINAQNDRITVVENNDTTQDNRLNALENKDTIHDSRLDAVEAKNVEQDNRLNEIEAIDVAQNSRLDAIEIKNQQQDDRLLDVEKVNKRQDMDLKCLFAESKNNMIDVTEEGNSVYLQNSTVGYTLIDEIQGNTMVNCNKEPDKEITLNGNINTQGYGNVTLTEGVDGGLVDVSLEGNTMVNVCDQKDPVAITKSYTVETGNHVALQGEYDGKCRPVVNGNTLVNLVNGGTLKFKHVDNDHYIYEYTFMSNLFKNSTTYTIIVNADLDGVYLRPLTGLYGYKPISNNRYAFTTKEEVISNDIMISFWKTGSEINIPVENVKVMILEGDYTDKPIPEHFKGLQSSFEDKVVTQEMVDNGEEVADNLGKYRVEYKVTGKNKFDGKMELGNINYNTGEFVPANNTMKSKKYIEVNPSTLYTITCSHDSRDVQYVFEYDYDKNFIKFTTVYGKITTTSETKFILTRSQANNFNGYILPDNLNTNIQLEEGDTATSYEPHKEYTKTLYLNSPLLEGDTIEEKDGGIYHVHRSELVAYTEGDETSLITDKVNTLHELETPTYELIEQSNLVIPSYGNGHLDLTSAVPVEKVDFLSFSEELTYLYANTQYTVQFISYAAIIVDITLGGAQLLAQNIVKGLNRISITTPATLANNKLIINGVGTNIMEVVVTDVNRELIYFEGMKSVGECEELQVISINSDKHLANTQQLTHEPLRGVGEVRDRYVLLDGNWYIERKCGIRTYQEGDEDNYKTDLINTVYPLDMPTYEEIDYNPLEVYSGTTRITTNSTIPPNIIVKNHGYNCLLKPSTTYTISSNLGLNTVTTGADIGDSCLRFMDTDTSDVTTMKDVLILEGDWTTKADLIPANFSGIESAFEQEYDAEKGKYKVNVEVANEDKSKENNITFYINEPLRGIGNVKDRIYVKDDKVVVQRNCGIRPYGDGDFGTYLTDKVDTVYPLVEPTYEEVEYNDTKLFIESFKNSTLFYNSNIPITSKLYYSYSVPIVDTVVKTASISDEQDSMIIDLATQVAVMEMMLM